MNLAKRLVWSALDSSPLKDVIRAFDLMSSNRLGRRGMLEQAFEFALVNGIQGDYFEFGVWRANTFRLAHRMKRTLGFKQMKLWAFDSFQGLPAIDDDKYNVFSAGEYGCSEEEFRSILRGHGVRDDEYQVVRGFYSDSLNQKQHQAMQGVSAALIWIDCDLYTSTIEALNFCPPYLMDGTVICFDDYYFYRGAPDQGEQKAIREFLDRHPHIQFAPYLDFAPVGKSFLVHLKTASPPSA